MTFKRPSLLLLALGLAGTASAALPEALPLRLPGPIVNSVPVIMPGITLEILPLTMPGAPSHADIVFPAPVVKPLPLQLPSVNAIPVAVIAARPLPIIDAVEAVIVRPQPVVEAVPTARALNELRDAAAGRESIRVSANKAFDGRRETVREAALPSGRFL